jgi:multidrug efflux pump subunit AcrB
MVVHLVSPSGRYDQLYLSLRQPACQDELARIAGVGSAQVLAPAGAVPFWLDPNRLASRRLTTRMSARDP